MKVVHIFRSVATAIVAFLVCTSQAQQDYSNTNIKNDTGKPKSILDITGDGGKIAELFITGKEAKFGDNQKLYFGSGYIQAVTNKYVNIRGTHRFTKPGETGAMVNQFLLGVNRIEWDDNGMTTKIEGIRPFIKTWFDEDLKVKTTNNPTIGKDGSITLDVEKMGKIVLDIRFGDKAKLVGDPVLVMKLGK